MRQYEGFIIEQGLVRCMTIKILWDWNQNYAWILLMRTNSKYCGKLRNVWTTTITSLSASTQVTTSTEDVCLPNAQRKHISRHLKLKNMIYLHAIIEFMQKLEAWTLLDCTKQIAFPSQNPWRPASMKISMINIILNWSRLDKWRLQCTIVLLEKIALWIKKN